MTAPHRPPAAAQPAEEMTALFEPLTGSLPGVARTRNLLLRHGIRTAAELRWRLAHDPQSLTDVRQFGPQCLELCRRALALYGTDRPGGDGRDGVQALTAATDTGYPAHRLVALLEAGAESGAPVPRAAWHLLRATGLADRAGAELRPYITLGQWRPPASPLVAWIDAQAWARIGEGTAAGTLWRPRPDPRQEAVVMLAVSLMGRGPAELDRVLGAIAMDELPALGAAVAQAMLICTGADAAYRVMSRGLDLQGARRRGRA